MQVNRRLLEPMKPPAPVKGRVTFWTVMSQVTQMMVVVAIGLIIFFIFMPGVRNTSTLQKELAALDTKIQEATCELADLNATAEALSKDPDSVLRFARDQLNVAKPGEMVFRFEPYRTPNKPASPSGH